MSDKHTPGPWEVCYPRNRFDCIRIFSGNRCIAYVGSANRRTDDDANAALIAAAPDMLAALEDAKRFIENGIQFGYINIPECDDPACETLDTINRAIAAAKGGQE